VLLRGFPRGSQQLLLLRENQVEEQSLLLLRLRLLRGRSHSALGELLLRVQLLRVLLEPVAEVLQPVLLRGEVVHLARLRREQLPDSVTRVCWESSKAFIFRHNSTRSETDCSSGLRGERGGVLARLSHRGLQGIAALAAREERERRRYRVREGEIERKRERKRKREVELESESGGER
jgi:hypothetical protein